MRYSVSLRQKVFWETQKAKKKKIRAGLVLGGGNLCQPGLSLRNIHTLLVTSPSPPHTNYVFFVPLV